MWSGKQNRCPPALDDAFPKAKRIWLQKPKDKGKILSWLARGSGMHLHKPYEFGCKVSVMTTVNASKGGHFVLQVMALHGNPYDGHTLKRAIEAHTHTVGLSPSHIWVDKGYRGHDPSLKMNVFKAGRKRLAPSLKREMRRRSVMEGVINHLKNDGHMGRNYLKVREGDKINALLSAVGHNFRRLLKWIRLLAAYLWALLSGFLDLIPRLFLPCPHKTSHMLS